MISKLQKSVFFENFMPLRLQLASIYLAYANKKELAITKNEFSRTFFVNKTPFCSLLNIILTFTLNIKIWFLFIKSCISLRLFLSCGASFL